MASMTKGLTERQRAILSFIEEFIALHNYSPSYKEIQKHFGFSSLGSVYKHIHVLKRKELLSSEPHCSRSLVPTKQTKIEKQVISEELKIPFIGQLSPGQPIELFLDWREVAVPPSLVKDPDQSYVIEIKGDSFASDHLLDGDLLIVETTRDALDGETTLALIREEETMVRTYFSEGIYTRLESRNPDIHPIVVPNEDIEVQGVIIGLIRLFHRSHL